MVGWIPPILEDRIERLREFSLRVDKCHATHPKETAFVPHYDSAAGDMRPWPWYLRIPFGFAFRTNPFTFSKAI